MLFPLDECHSYLQNTYDITEGATAVTSGVTYAEGPWGNPTGASEFTIGSYIEIPYLDAVDTQGSLTIVVHMYPTSFEDSILVSYRVLDNNGVEEQGVQLQKYKNGILFHLFERGIYESTYHLAISGEEDLTLDAWNYVIATYDYDTGVIVIYINGNNVGTADVPTMAIKTNGIVRVGTVDGDSRQFEGRLACLRVYKRSWTADEVATSEECPIRKYRSRMVCSARNIGLQCFVTTITTKT